MQKNNSVSLPANLVIALQGHDKPLCVLANQLISAGFQVAGIQSFPKSVGEKDAKEWTGYLTEHGLYESIHDFAQKKKTELQEVEDANSAESIAWLKKRNVNFVISLGSRWILKKPFLEEFKEMVINMHPSPLPLYGGGPVQTWQILNQETESAWTAHWINTAVDSGDIIFQLPHPLPSNPTNIELLQSRLVYFEKFLKEFLPQLKSGNLPRTKMDLSKRLYFFSLYTPRDAQVDFSWQPEEIERFIRAFGLPYAGAFAHFKKSNGDITKVHFAKAEVINQLKKYFHPFAQGNILNYTADDGVLVNLKTGIIKITTVRDGYREIPAKQVLKIGGRFIKE